MLDTQISKETIELVFAAMVARYPKAFSPKGKGKEVRPLEIGIAGKLKELHPEIPDYILSAFLRRYVRSWQYQRALSCRKFRVDLTGAKVSEIDRRHRDYARAILAARIARLGPTETGRPPCDSYR